jgi:hypothetical protein
VVACLVHSLSQEIPSHSPTYQVGYTPAIRTNLTLTPPSTRFTHTSQLSLYHTILRKLVFSTLNFPRPSNRQKMDRRARAKLPTPSSWARPNSGREPEATEDDSGTSLLLPHRARANLPTLSGWAGPNSGREFEAIEEDSGTSLLLPLLLVPLFYRV